MASPGKVDLLTDRDMLQHIQEKRHIEFGSVISQPAGGVFDDFDLESGGLTAAGLLGGYLNSADIGIAQMPRARSANPYPQPMSRMRADRSEGRWGRSIPAISPAMRSACSAESS